MHGAAHAHVASCTWRCALGMGRVCTLRALLTSRSKCCLVLEKHVWYAVAKSAMSKPASDVTDLASTRDQM